MSTTGGGGGGGMVELYIYRYVILRFSTPFFISFEIFCQNVCLPVVESIHLPQNTMRRMNSDGETQWWGVRRSYRLIHDRSDVVLIGVSLF